MDSIFEQDDYRETLKSRVKSLQVRRPGLTWKKLASEVPMQYTFLSKALNSETTHLNEDHLFTIAKSLEFFPDEIDFLLLQRAHAVSQDRSRKEYLFKKIEGLRRKNKIVAEERTFSSSQLMSEMSYLFDPFAVVVHVALDIPEYQRDPRKLCSPIGISVAKLREILRTLSASGFIELDEDGITVKKLLNMHLHFGREHALMRHHQSLLKTQINSRLSQVDEADKVSFLTTFSMDDRSYEQVKEHFQTFIKKVESVARESKSKRVYQLSFDLFKWF